MVGATALFGLQRLQAVVLGLGLLYSRTRLVVRRAQKQSLLCGEST